MSDKNEKGKTQEEKPQDPYQKYKDFKWENPEQFKNGPIDDDSRKCRDVICCIIFILIVILCVIVAAFGFIKGEPSKLFYFYYYYFLFLYFLVNFFQRFLSLYLFEYCFH